MAKATVMAVVNQKGGTGKTTTCENLGVGLAMEGKKVLLVDTDPQASLTICLGHPVPDQLSPTLSDMMGKILSEQPIAPGEGILHHPEGVDLMPANIELSGLEVSLVNAMSRETILKQYLDTVKQNYDFILLDCMPSLGMLTVNALAAADNVLIPVQAAYLPAKGLEQLLQTINKVRRQINPKLRIEGILLTMVDSRTNYSKDISNLIRENYGGMLKQLWIVPVNKMAYFFSKFAVVLVYSVCFMLITAAASILTGVLPGYIAFDSGSVLYLLRKCMEISLLTAFAVLPILAAAAAQKGYILPVCLTLVYTFLGFILLMVNMYLHPLSSMTAIVMRDIPGVVITQPLNIPGAFLCIGVWGVASVLLAGAALKKRK